MLDSMVILLKLSMTSKITKNQIIIQIEYALKGHCQSNRKLQFTSILYVNKN